MCGHAFQSAYVRGYVSAYVRINAHHGGGQTDTNTAWCQPAGCVDTYVLLCVRGCVDACERTRERTNVCACVLACVRACARMSECECMRASVR